jgi:hypothetical protein
VAIYRILQSSAFGPEAINRIAKAYEDVLRKVQLNEQDGPVGEIIAKKIIEIAQTGERDPTKISALALKQLGLPSSE